tara:strand:+ start:40 stop:519 length:480 start_codon:yes stop_codon:yes gene_type:complete
MRKEFVMRGKTASGEYDILEFGGRQKENKNMAYRMTEFLIYPSSSIGTAHAELAATVTAGKLTGTPPASPSDPANPDFEQEGLIASALFGMGDSISYPKMLISVVNDTFLITQNLVIAAIDTISGAPMATNWQCRFEAVKMTDAQTAATNFKQFTISDE